MSSHPVDVDVALLRDRVRAQYERLALDPHGVFHFASGARYAVEVLGYDAAELAQLPATATDRFAGVGNPLAIGPLHAGETVLDHGCGAGTDLLLAARRVGWDGHAIGVDMTPSMRACATRAAREAGLDAVVEIRAGLVEDLPVDDASVDVVISNGVLNLAPDKKVVLAEAFRVLKPGGRLYLADVAVERDFSPEVRRNTDLWAACVAGALPERSLAVIAESVGFIGAHVTERFSSFRGTAAEQQVRGDMHIRGVNLFALRPAGAP